MPHFVYKVGLFISKHETDRSWVFNDADEKNDKLATTSDEGGTQMLALKMTFIRIGPNNGPLEAKCGEEARLLV